MSRLFLVSCVLASVLAWPVASNAQALSGNCQFSAYISVKLPQADPKAPARPTEIRGTSGIPIEVRCPGDVLLIAREIDYFQSEERIVARGQVVFQQAGIRIAAVRGEFSVKTELGFFEDASGTLQLTDRQIDRSLFGTQEPEAVFSAERIEKTGPITYALTKAVFSACVQPTKRWELTAQHLTLKVDHYAILRSAVLRVKDVALLYLPVFYYPIQEDNRATGFLMPSYGSSNFRGLTLSNAFFWAINRSQDATVYHDWFASSGQGFGADYRYVGGPNSRGDGRVYLIREKARTATDGTIIDPARRSFEVRGNVSQTLPGRIRFQARADYFSDATAQQLYQVDLSAFSRRSRFFGADVSGNWGRLRVSAQAERNDVFYGTAASSYRYQPRVNVGISEAPILRSRFRFGASFDTMNVVRYDDVERPETRVAVLRTDGSATMRSALRLGSALSVDGSVTLRRTDWNRSRDPVSGAFIEVPLTRNLVETRARISGPTLVRIFNTPGNGFAERFKHVIEPYATVQTTSTFDRFKEVIQFDQVDTILGGVTRVTYGVMNRLLARVRQGEGPTAQHEIMNFELSQTYYTNSLAASYDQQYQTSFGNLYQYTLPPSNFSPLRAALNFMPSDAARAQFGVEYDTQYDAVRTYSASLNTTFPVFDFDGSWSKRQVIPGLPGFDDPRFADHFVRVSTRVKKPSGGASLSYSTTYDVLRERVLQQRFVGFYNAQCCGVAMDYAVTNLSHLGLRNDKRFSLSLTLAGVGSFANLLGVFGGNNGTQR